MGLNVMQHIPITCGVNIVVLSTEVIDIMGLLPMRIVMIMIIISGTKVVGHGMVKNRCARHHGIKHVIVCGTMCGRGHPQGMLRLDVSIAHVTATYEERVSKVLVAKNVHRPTKRILKMRRGQSQVRGVTRNVHMLRHVIMPSLGILKLSTIIA